MEEPLRVPGVVLKQLQTFDNTRDAQVIVVVAPVPPERVVSVKFEHTRSRVPLRIQR